MPFQNTNVKANRRRLVLVATACLLWISVTSYSVAIAMEQKSSTVVGHEESGKDQAANAGSVHVTLPLQKGSLRFAVIGDSGTGDRDQLQVAGQMEAYRRVTNFDFVIMLGDNIYGNHSPGDFEKKFAEPYKPLLDAGVKFYASLGNHDDPRKEPLYKPFNMGGKRYYSFSKGDTEFFALDSNYMDPKQLDWVGQNLRNSHATWKICFFHHPLYNDGRHHGPDRDLRSQLLPLFQRYGVNVVFSGHEHVYERMKLEDNIDYFVLGNSGKLMKHDFRGPGERVKGFDEDRTFMIVEIAGDKMYFQVISRTGETVDSGTLPRSSTNPDK
ncbi:MAG TPA: metallophosphoesterase [Candidatus Angelobacter sp.]|nr:metallophosphoesterase [Candidatus Angelobacter sp.]